MMDITMDEPGQSIRQMNKRAPAYFISPPETATTIASKGKGKERETARASESNRAELEEAAGESVK
jgi:hypothetical protein